MGTNLLVHNHVDCAHADFDDRGLSYSCSHSTLKGERSFRKSKGRTFAVWLFACIIVTGWHNFYRTMRGSSFGSLRLPATFTSTSTSSTTEITSIFSGSSIRTYKGDRLLANLKDSKKRKPFPLLAKECDAWAVVTTMAITEPSQAVKVVAKLRDYCVVIVGDSIAPDDYLQRGGLDGRDDIVYLSVQAQKEIQHAFVEMIPLNSFARKNIGFLFAVRHGAKVIFDFDDDNVLKPLDPTGSDPDHPISPFALKTLDRQSVNVRYLEGADQQQDLDGRAFNPYPLMYPSVEGAWPRGFPLEDLNNPLLEGGQKVLNGGSIPLESIGVIQSLCDGDPDVDAIYRLTRPLPIAFDGSATTSNLLVPVCSYAPYNAKATVHMYGSFWGLLLPITVLGRVSDIWRSFFTQRIFQDLNLAVLYAPPMVTHKKNNSHNYNQFADMEPENDLYKKTSKLLTFLSKWNDPETYLPVRIEKLAIALYERDYAGLADIETMQQWLLALHDMGYNFPTISKQQQQQPQQGNTDTTDSNSKNYCNTKRLKPVQQFMLEGQPFRGRPYFNVGGANGTALTYPEYIKKKAWEPSEASWSSWLTGWTGSSSFVSNKPPDGGDNNTNTNNDLSFTNGQRPSQLILKLVVMTKNEWPLIKLWTLYHGEMLGFEHIYIIDASTDPRCINWLKWARDVLGAQVIFSTASLNKVTAQMNEIGRAIQGSSDLSMKVDTDEFLLLNTKEKSCVTPPNAGAESDCTLSPYAISGYLKDIDNFYSTADGRRMRVGYMQHSVPDKNLCSENRGFDLGEFSLSPVFDASWYKAVLDSRSFKNYDLGGHMGGFFAPHDKNVEYITPLSIAHYHFRCAEDEKENCRKTCISHDYISATDSDAEALEKLKKYTGPETCRSISCDGMANAVASCHKISCVTTFLSCPEQFDSEYYRKGPINTFNRQPYFQVGPQNKPNPDFQQFLGHAMEKYDSSDSS